MFSYGNAPFKVPGPKTLCSSPGNSKGPIIYIESSGEERLTPDKHVESNQQSGLIHQWTFEYIQIQRNWVVQLGIAELCVMEEFILVI